MSPKESVLKEIYRNVGVSMVFAAPLGALYGFFHHLSEGFEIDSYDNRKKPDYKHSSIVDSAGRLLCNVGAGAFMLGFWPITAPYAVYKRNFKDDRTFDEIVKNALKDDKK